MKEVYYFLYRDYRLNGKIFSSEHFDSFEEAAEARKKMEMKSGLELTMPTSPVKKAYLHDVILDVQNTNDLYVPCANCPNNKGPGTVCNCTMAPKVVYC